MHNLLAEIEAKKGWCLLVIQSKHLVQFVLTDKMTWFGGGVSLSFSETVSTFGTKCERVVVYVAIH